jgi:uncharacterized membrane protein YdjX (TVP38/TMEM64 family)
MSQGTLTRGRVIALAVLCLLVVVVGLLWGPDAYRLLVDRETVQAWVAGFGAWGPLVSILLNIAQVLLAPVPGQTVGVANGYLYGILAGTLYSWIGVQLGSALAMGLARFFGRPLVVRLVGKEQLGRWDRLAQRQGPVFFFLVFLFPLVPDDVICFVIGLSPLSIPYMLALAGVGRLPGLLVASWVGASATSLPLWAWGVLAVGAVGLALAFWRYQRALEEATTRLIRRLLGPCSADRGGTPPPGVLD